jgi:hypothetical protein
MLNETQKQEYSELLAQLNQTQVRDSLIFHQFYDSNIFTYSIPLTGQF